MQPDTCKCYILRQIPAYWSPPAGAASLCECVAFCSVAAHISTTRRGKQNTDTSVISKQTESQQQGLYTTLTMKLYKETTISWMPPPPNAIGNKQQVHHAEYSKKPASELDGATRHQLLGDDHRCPPAPTPLLLHVLDDAMNATAKLKGKISITKCASQKAKASQKRPINLATNPQEQRHLDSQGLSC